MENIDTLKAKRVRTPSTPLALYRRSGGGEAAGIDFQFPLVLGHALGSSKDMWNQVVQILPADLPLILWEQPGHGESGLLQVPEPSVLDTASAVIAGLEDIGVRKAHFAGLSLGGMTTLGLAQQFPDAAASFAVLDSGPAALPAKPWLEKADQVRNQGLQGLVDGTMERWFTTSFAEGEGREQVKRIRDIFLQTNPEGYAQCCQILANTDLRDQNGRARSSALVLTGEDDPGTTPDQARELAGALPNVNEVIIVTDARHLTAVEQPEAVAGALLNHIRGALKI